MSGKLHLRRSKSRWRRDRIGQLIGMNIVNLSVVCKLIFAFPPETICVSDVI